ncbi:MAG TPA: hypothetical protein VFN79_05070 [Steroidobacteraceae bacterium]|nr:hypothetical protein [Steroidobacteraceae bacterium]
MSAVILAVFGSFDAADRARLALVHDGFPTDRVGLTARLEPGPAGLEPGGSQRERFSQFFHVLFGRGEERQEPERLTQLVLEHGAAAVSVLPRGDIENRRALELLSQAHPREVLRHDLEKHLLEFASSSHEAPWIRSLWVKPAADEPECIYCRLFPGSAHEKHAA